MQVAADETVQLALARLLEIVGEAAGIPGVPRGTSRNPVRRDGLWPTLTAPAPADVHTTEAISFGCRCGSELVLGPDRGDAVVPKHAAHRIRSWLLVLQIVQVLCPSAPPEEDAITLASDHRIDVL